MTSLESSRVWTLLIVSISAISAATKVEQTVAPVGQTFSFDCKLDESVYFARRLDDWSEVQENDNKFIALNLNFNFLTSKNILRVTANPVQAENHGYYGCRTATWATTAMSRTYQLIVADVQSFYWTHTCHAPAGSCVRIDDSSDETLSTFEVADRTNVNLYCCAAVTGYNDITVNMNQVGEIRGKINVHRKQELDGSWVVCANQHTMLKRGMSRNEETLTCELLTGGQVYSTLSSIIMMKDEIPSDPAFDPPTGYTPPPPRGNGNGHFEKSSSAGRRGRLPTGKRIAVILGSVLGGLVLLGLVLILIFLFCRRRQASKNTTVSNYSSSVRTNEKRDLPDDGDYLQPTPLYANVPIVFRV